MARGPSQMGHEVDDDVEDDSHDEFGRQVHENGADSFRGRVVECILVVFFNDGSLFPLGQDLQRTGKGI